MFLSLLLATTLAPNTYLIPTPNSLITKAGTFKLERHASIVVANKSDDEDSYAAEGLIDESPASFGWGKPRKGQLKVTVGRIGRDRDVDRELKSLNLKFRTKVGPDAYILSVRPDHIVCAGNSAAGTFYAVQTLKQLIRTNAKTGEIPCLDIVDWPALEMRGWQDDISRGPIPTLDFLKKEVKELSEYKLNTFTLYTEHVFKLKKHPTIAPKDGISAEEIVELDKFCKKHHVQLIANFQSFGHFANILNVPGYENLQETPNVITPAKEESYTFLKDVFNEVASAYSSPYFNINCDETYGLGDGPAKDMVKKEGLGNVYAKHINRVSALLKSHNKTPMMWGDIALQYPDIRKNLPKDLIVLTWGYDPRDSFFSQIDPFTKIGFEFLVCPGVSCWGQIFPDLDSATTNICNFSRDGILHGAKGMLNTTWDDTGENLFNNNWYPLVWGAEVSWSYVGHGTLMGVQEEEPSPEMVKTDTFIRKQRLSQFDQAFPRLFYGLPDGKLSQAFWSLSRLRNYPVSNGLSDNAFWKAPWELETKKRKENDGFAQTVSSVVSLLLQSKATSTRNAESLDAALLAASRMAYLHTQSNAMSEFSDLLKAPAEFRAEIAQEGTSSLANQLKLLKEKYIAAWKLECRPWWLDRNTSKFDRAITNMDNLALIPIFDPPAGTAQKGLKVQMATVMPGTVIHYTLDGSEPTDSSPLYAGPLEISQSTLVKAMSTTTTARRSPVITSLYTMLTRPAKIETAWSHYADHANEKAFDGLLDTYFWSNGSVDKGATFTVTLDDPEMIAGLKVTTGHPDHADDWLKEGTLEVSTDGERWREMAKFEKGVAECGMIGFRVKAIRIKVGRENGNWLVIREIEIRQ